MRRRSSLTGTESAGTAFYERDGWLATGVTADNDVHCELSLPEVEYRKALS